MLGRHLFIGVVLIMEVIQIIQKPYNISIKGVTIDAEEINVVTWKVSGALQYSYAITILDNVTNETVYAVSKTTSYVSSHSIPADALYNNEQYKISIQVWEVGDASTASSDYEVFQTSTRPVVAVSTIGTVANPSNTFTASYTQVESVPMRSWIAYLYNSSSNIIAQSGIQATASTPLLYLFDALASGSSYFVEFQATSDRGLTGTSGKVSFNVLYDTPKVDVFLTARNVENAGMEISWDAIQIVGHSNDPIYVDNEELDTRNENKVWFDSGYNITNDLTLRTWIREIINREISENGEIVSYSSTPTNLNTMWILDSTQSTPTFTSFSVKSTPPDPNVSRFWIPDSTQTIGRTLNLSIQDVPPSNSFVWIEQESFASQSRLVDMVGDNGRLSIEYYSGVFHLASYDENNNRTLLDSSSAIGNEFYVYIQQIGDSYNIGATTLS